MGEIGEKNGVIFLPGNILSGNQNIHRRRQFFRKLQEFPDREIQPDIPVMYMDRLAYIILDIKAIIRVLELG